MLNAKQLSSADARKEKLLEIVHALPEATASVYGESHLTITVRKKNFAYYCFDHHDDGRIAVWLKARMEEKEALVEADPETFFSPPYLGVRGWVAIRIDRQKVNWDAVRDLLRAAYVMSAPKKLVAQLDD